MTSAHDSVDQSAMEAPDTSDPTRDSSGALTIWARQIENANAGEKVEAGRQTGGGELVQGQHGGPTCIL